MLTKDGGQGLPGCTVIPAPLTTAPSARFARHFQVAFGGKCSQGACFSRCFKGIKYSILGPRCERPKFARNATLENIGFPTA